MKIIEDDRRARPSLAVAEIPKNRASFQKLLKSGGSLDQLVTYVMLEAMTVSETPFEGITEASLFLSDGLGGFWQYDNKIKTRFKKDVWVTIHSPRYWDAVFSSTWKKAVRDKMPLQEGESSLTATTTTSATLTHNITGIDLDDCQAILDSGFFYGRYEVLEQALIDAVSGKEKDLYNYFYNNILFDSRKGLFGTGNLLVSGEISDNKASSASFTPDEAISVFLPWLQAIRVHTGKKVWKAISDSPDTMSSIYLYEITDTLASDNPTLQKLNFTSSFYGLVYFGVKKTGKKVSNSGLSWTFTGNFVSDIILYFEATDPVTPNWHGRRMIQKSVPAHLRTSSLRLSM